MIKNVEMRFRLKINDSQSCHTLVKLHVLNHYERDKLHSLCTGPIRRQTEFSLCKIYVRWMITFTFEYPDLPPLVVWSGWCKCVPSVSSLHTRPCILWWPACCVSVRSSSSSAAGTFSSTTVSRTSRSASCLYLWKMQMITLARGLFF